MLQASTKKKVLCLFYLIFDCMYMNLTPIEKFSEGYEILNINLLSNQINMNPLFR